jgi:hypothetical protein
VRVFGVSFYRVWAPLLLCVGLLAGSGGTAQALPYETDERCPNVNTVAFKLELEEEGHPELEAGDYYKVAQAYVTCMKQYDNSPNTWMIFYAGTHAMQWALGAGNLLLKTDKSTAQKAFVMVHQVYVYVVSAGIDNAQYGNDYLTMEGAALKQLASMGVKP